MEAIRYRDGVLELLDQRALPAEHRWIEARSSAEVAEAIRSMAVRGAPAIGIAAAWGLALAVRRGEDRAEARARLLAARPTAVNLRHALEGLDGVPDEGLEAAARALHEADVARNRALGAHGARLLEKRARNGRVEVVHICNTGALATGGHGTALGIVRSAVEAGLSVHVWVLETRPWLQGARLTTTELRADGIPCTLLVDGAAAALLATGRVGAALAGCDRVAANGDVANKIGTRGLAVLCRHHGVPLYVAMPLATLDPTCPDGAAIPIEERPPDEVRRLAGVPVAPADVPVWNPAFDITPAELVGAWVTEDGLWRPPARDRGGAAPPSRPSGKRGTP